MMRAYQGIDIGEVSKLRRPSGRPEIELSGWAATAAAKRRVAQRSLSFADTSGFAVATVLLLANSAGEG
jgi:phosphopantetheinyl transferase (holo-ACP synthase)